MLPGFTFEDTVLDTLDPSEGVGDGGGDASYLVLRVDSMLLIASRAFDSLRDAI